MFLTTSTLVWNTFGHLFNFNFEPNFSDFKMNSFVSAVVALLMVAATVSGMYGSPGFGFYSRNEP